MLKNARIKLIVIIMINYVNSPHYYFSASQQNLANIVFENEPICVYKY